ncbi:MAG: penicillin-binding protein 2 [Magnetococcales bacterium]|nr:penicillin-binding protein 2 [Magnetococcales bacterium]
MLEDDHELFRVDARRRLVFMGGMAGMLFSMLGIRLFHLQVLRGGAYRDLAENNRISMVPIPAPRGRIFDRYGEILVENQPDYRLAVIPELAGPLDAVLLRLRNILEMTDQDIEQVLRQARRNRSFLPLKIKSHLTWEEVSRVEARIHDFPGTIIQTQSIRHYPFANLACHILGYLGEVNDRDRRSFHSLGLRSGDLVGKTGMEQRFESALRGREGVQEMEVNALGRQVRELSRADPASGQDLYSTIDVALQRDAEQALGDRNGSVVVLDPRSGEVLAMVSSPSYDPNQFIQGITRDQWKGLITNPGRPLSNKAIQGQYPPGSTFKIVVALAALTHGRVSPTDQFFCSGHIELEKLRLHCWKKHGHGSMNMIQALTQSCDVYFYRVAERLGIDLLESFARKFGMGELTGIPLNEERQGLMPGREWKRGRFRTAWYPGETLIAAIGQGYVLTTPLQLANMISAVANGGILYQPSLVRPAGKFDPVVRRNLRLKPEHLAVVRAGLDAVLNRPGGTATASAPIGVRAAGKTGTAQVVRHRRDEAGRLLAPNDPRHRDHALFVSYAPVDNPELAIAVVVEHGGHGGSTAAPVAKRIMEGYFQRRTQQGGPWGGANG